MKLKDRIFLSMFISSFVIVLLVGIVFYVSSYQAYSALIGQYNESAYRWVDRIINILSMEGEITPEQFDYIHEDLYSEEKIDPALLYIFDCCTGEVILHKNRDLIGTRIDNLPYIQQMIEEKTGSLRYDEQLEPYIGRTRISYFYYLEEQEWILVVGPMLDEVIDIIMMSIIIGVSQIILVIIINAFATRAITKSIYNPIEKSGKKIRAELHRLDPDNRLLRGIHDQVDKMVGRESAIENTLTQIKKATDTENKKH